MLYSFYLPCYIICYIGLPPMLSTILYTTYSVYHARMGGVAVLDEILDKLSIGLFLPGKVFYNTLAGSENLKTRRLAQAAIHTKLYTMLYTMLYRIWNLPPQLPWQNLKFYPLCLVQEWEDPSRRVSNSALSIPYRPFMSPARARSMPSPERGESGLSGSIP